MTPVIWWIRRDLRLTDNQALTEALRHGDEVIPVFILDDTLLNSPYSSEKRVDFMFNGLRSLDHDLKKIGSRLFIRRGNPKEVLQTIIQETGASQIFAEADVSPYARQRDEAIRESLPLTLVDGLTVRPPGSVLKVDGTPYTVFTPFSKAWKRSPLPMKDDILPVPERIVTPHISSLPVPESPTMVSSFTAGEAEAERRLRDFIIGSNAPIYSYETDRNLPGVAGTSSLSPYLRWGMISAKRAIVAIHYAMDNAPDQSGYQSAGTWLNELIWREFYIHILYHFPYVRERNFRSEYDSMGWIADHDDFLSWCEGLTGYPIIDAGMRQLIQTGWMHNRVRMLVASFLVKDLLIDWRWGERFFMNHLLDGDPSANNGGWQWTAGTGTDSVPYFRIFNPVTQSRKFDPEGRYIRKWVPELRELDNKSIHTPWETKPETLKQAGVVLGETYPYPIVDRKLTRERTLQAYRLARENR